MKEYKSITITTRNIENLGNRLNKYTEKGWYIKDTLFKRIEDPGYTHQFIYLLERNKPPSKSMLELCDTMKKVSEQIDQDPIK